MRGRGPTRRRGIRTTMRPTGDPGVFSLSLSGWGKNSFSWPTDFLLPRGQNCKTVEKGKLGGTKVKKSGWKRKESRRLSTPSYEQRQISISKLGANKRDSRCFKGNFFPSSSSSSFFLSFLFFSSSFSPLGKRSIFMFTPGGGR